MEAFWNYVYFQTLGINAFDEIGHVLRIVLFNQGPCPPYVAEARPRPRSGTATPGSGPTSPA